ARLLRSPLFPARRAHAGSATPRIEKTGIHPPSVTPGNQPVPSSTRVIACNEERGALNLGYYPGSVARLRPGDASRVSPGDRRRIPRQDFRPGAPASPPPPPDDEGPPATGGPASPRTPATRPRMAGPP